MIAGNSSSSNGSSCISSVLPYSIPTAQVNLDLMRNVLFIFLGIRCHTHNLKFTEPACFNQSSSKPHPLGTPVPLLSQPPSFTHLAPDLAQPS